MLAVVGVAHHAPRRVGHHAPTQVVTLCVCAIVVFLSQAHASSYWSCTALAEQIKEKARQKFRH